MQGSILIKEPLFLALIISFLACSTYQNQKVNAYQMNELKLSNAEIQEIVYTDQTNIHKFTFKYVRKLNNAVFYYQQHSGKIEDRSQKEKCQVMLTKKHHELPRSVYPLLTQGYIVVQTNWLGMETYQVIKDFKTLEPLNKNE